MKQTKIIKRTKELCDEFDKRAQTIGVSFARAEFAKMLAELEDENERLMDSLPLIEDGFGNHTSLYCLKCLRPTMQVVRPGSFQCARCINE